MEKSQLCLECGKPLYGRTDKKFCSSACKNGWHYQHSADLRNLKSWTNTALTRNYRILRSLPENEESRFSLAELQLRGFSPQLVTSHLGTSGNVSHYACFDIHYCQTDTEIFNVHLASLH